MKTRALTAAVALSALALSGAALAAATVRPAPAATQSEPTSATYTVDSVHSSVMFKVKHANVANFYGMFRDVSGEYRLADGGTVDVQIKTESVDTRNSRRDEHLRNADFFLAKEFPVLSFKSKSVKQTGENTFEATGDLTMRGVTKPITVTIEQTGAGEMRGTPVSGIESRFTIKRSEFGMTYGQGSLSDEVEITVALEGQAK